MSKKNIIIGITGASGAIYGVRLLEILKAQGVTTHLVMTKAANITISYELDMKVSEIQSLASFYYAPDEINARIASGSFKTDGMVIAPCSIRSMSAIATGITSDLVTRAADVTLKEHRRLVVMLRETPLHLGHLENMAKLAAMGAIIAPPVPAFYNRPKTIDDIVNHSVGRVMDLLDVEADFVKRWRE